MYTPVLCVAVPVVIVVAAVVRSSQSLLLQHVKKKSEIKEGGREIERGGGEVGIEKRDEREAKDGRAARGPRKSFN